MEFGRELDGSNGCPEWLAHDVKIMGFWLEWAGPYSVDCVQGFGESYFKFKLPIDHFAYKALDAGFEPWGGGDEGPEDWDGGACIMRDGVQTYPAYWAHNYGDSDIIGYRRRETTERFETVDELMEELNKEYLVRIDEGAGYTVSKVYEHVIGSDDIYDDDGDCRRYFDFHFRPATPAEISAYKQAYEIIPTGTMAPIEEVLVRRMTRDEAMDHHWDIATLEDLGLLIDETPIQRFEREHGGLDNNQRDIVEAFIEWSAGK